MVGELGAMISEFVIYCVGTEFQSLAFGKKAGRVVVWAIAHWLNLGSQVVRRYIALQLELVRSFCGHQTPVLELVHVSLTGEI